MKLGKRMTVAIEAAACLVLWAVLLGGVFGAGWYLWTILPAWMFWGAFGAIAGAATCVVGGRDRVRAHDNAMRDMRRVCGEYRLPDGTSRKTSAWYGSALPLKTRKDAEHAIDEWVRRCEQDDPDGRLCIPDGRSALPNERKPE